MRAQITNSKVFDIAQCNIIYWSGMQSRPSQQFAPPRPASAISFLGHTNRSHDTASLLPDIIV